MRRTALALLLPLLLLASACVGGQVRQNVLIPDMRLSFSAIEPYVGESQMDEALDTGEPLKVKAVNWPMLRVKALAAIDAAQEAGDIGPGTARALKERVRLFDEAWARL